MRSGQLCAAGELEGGGAGRGCINFADEVNVDSWLKLSAMAGSREWTVSLLRVTFPPNGKTKVAQSLAAISADWMRYVSVSQTLQACPLRLERTCSGSIFWPQAPRREATGRSF